MQEPLIQSSAMPRAASLPADPRARNVLASLTHQARSTLPWTTFRRDKASAGLDVAWLYGVLRLARPRQALILGRPSTAALVLVAAAIADGGGQRLLCHNSCTDCLSAYRPWIARAGLDWLVRCERRIPDQFPSPDALILADPDSNNLSAWESADVRLAPGGLVIGLESAAPCRVARRASTLVGLQQRGMSAMWPNQPDLSFWAAIETATGGLN